MTRRRGFTLIELLVAVALLVILTGVIVFVFGKAVQVFITADVRAQIYQNVRSGVDMMRREIMSAEPLLKEDGLASNQQRLRIENGTYVNTKWSTTFPADVLKIWKVSSADSSGGSNLVYAKYWLDTAASLTVPILKRKTSPVNTAGNWMTAGNNDPTTATSDLTEELMQYVVGFDVEPYYPNQVGAALPGKSYWNLATGSGLGGNDFRDALNAFAGVSLYTIQTNSASPTGTTDVKATNPWAAGNLDISSISDIANAAWYTKRAVFATAAPTSGAPFNLTTWGSANQRAVSALPKGMRLTFYVRDERSKEQRCVQDSVWIPMW